MKHSSNLDFWKSSFDQGIMKTPHCRHKVINPIIIFGEQDFGTNQYIFDLRLRMKWAYVLLNPSSCCDGVGKTRNVPIANRDRNRNTSVCKSSKDIGISIKQFDAVKNSLGFKEVGNHRGGRKVVCSHAIVDSNAGYGREELEEHADEEKNGGHGYGRYRNERQLVKEKADGKSVNIQQRYS
ncbi:hypothetical protein V6N12_002265 [Hibiscus sabdariffa]|uniref:Uncharacterized protein n=1 Tax=Hibiscus sabdariffa TaxID=183260 RepID=A0ABR2B0B5_9ROSI